MKARKEEAEDIFARWLESVEKGDAPPFAELCAQHAEHAPELERLFDNWEKFPALQPLAPGQSSDSDLFRGPQSLGDSKALLTHGKRIGRYELERELGRGGMGVVWLARDLVLGDHVALKFLPQVLTADRIAMLRLRREAKVLLALTHTNIVRLRTIESSSGLTFLIEEFLAGPTLAELLEERLERNERGLACAEIRWLIGQLAPALEYAHGEGVTHRDIKPSNMMLDALPGEALGAGRERAKLTDFGLAFVANSALSQISSYRPSGTLPYMAPEVLMGGKPTPAADIYSLGVTVYCLVAGRPPFTHGDIAAQILHSRPERLESGDKHIDAAVLAAMAKRPEDRPASVLDFLAILRGEKKAPSPSRRPLLKRLASVAVTLGLAGAGWFAWQELAGREAQSTQTASAAEISEPPLLPVTVQLDPPFGLDKKLVVLGVKERGLGLRGRITNARSNGFAVILDGFELPARVEPDGSFSVRPALTAGVLSTVRIEVEGADPIEFEVELDLDKPVLTLVEPNTSHWTTSEESFAVEVQVEERNPGSVHLDELALESLGEGRWRASSIPLRPGDNARTLRATDKAGNMDSLTIHVVQESQSIALAACEPARGSQVFLREPVPLKLSFDHPVESASFAGKPLTLAADARSATGELIADTLGTWRGSWSARDPAGEVENGELEFVVAVRGQTPEVGGRKFLPLDPEPGWDRWARRIQDPDTKIVFRLVDPGAFRMGSRPLTARMDEEPWREVHISKPYYLAETEVTRAQWRTFAEPMAGQTSAERTRKAIARVPGDTGKAKERDGANWRSPEPDHAFEFDDTHPVSQVSWHDARAFCARFGFRLPTEAEWEYACRAGSSSIYPWGDRAEGIEQRANLADASLSRRFSGLPAGKATDDHAFTAPVDSFAANPWGFQDMLGNVWEWCEDAYDPAAYLSEELDPLAAIVGGPRPAIVTNPAVTASDAEQPRVLRGGSWLTPPSEARPARRSFDLPDRASDTRGFRPAFWPDAPVPPVLLTTWRDRVQLSLDLLHADGSPRLSMQCVHDDEGNLVGDGEYTRRYPENRVAESGKLELGNRDGTWSEFHSNGKNRAKGPYVQDRRQKKWSFWHSDGTLRVKGEYSQGWPVGSWEFSEPDGRHTGIYAHAELPEGEGATLGGESHGWWTFQWPNGIRRFDGNYQNGARSGVWRFWHPEGTFDTSMLSGAYEGDRRIALGDPLWLPEPEDYAALPVRPTELGDLVSLLGRENDSASKYGDRLENLCDVPPAEVERALVRLGQDPAAMPPLVRMLLELELRDEADVSKGQRLMRALQHICNERSFPWRVALAPADQDLNRLQVLRTTSLWLLTRSSAIFWKLEIPIGGGQSDDPVLATAEEPLDAHVFQNPLLYAPSQYGQLPRFDPRAVSSRLNPPRAGKTRVAVDGALLWLARHQSKDGSWDCDGFPKNCVKALCGGVGSAAHDVGVTGLALLAFLGAGNSVIEGPYQENVMRGVRWLLMQQGEEGFFGQRIPSTPHGSPHMPPPEAQEPQVREPVAKEPGERDCSTCSGTGINRLGKKPFPCTTCGATGKVPTYDELPLSPESNELLARFGESSSSNLYDHAIATQAICTALSRTPSADALRQAARKAVALILQGQNPYSAWRSIPNDGDNDTSITAWMMFALAAARDAQLPVDTEALVNALTWIDQMTNPSNGRTGYTDMGGFPARFSTLAAQFPPEYSESMTAAGVLARVLAGHTAEDDPMIALGADRMTYSLPLWDDVGHVDYYYWYLGSLAMFQVGGPRWDRWNEAIKTAIIDHQRMDESEDEFGSWDPVDPWGSAGGRIYSTAILALALEVPWTERRGK